MQSLRWNLLGEVLKGFVKDSQQYRGVLSTKDSCEILEAGVEPGLDSELSLQDRKPLPPFDERELFKEDFVLPRIALHSCSDQQPRSDQRRCSAFFLMRSLGWD